MKLYKKYIPALAVCGIASFFIQTAYANEYGKVINNSNMRAKFYVINAPHGNLHTAKGVMQPGSSFYIEPGQSVNFSGTHTHGHSSINIQIQQANQSASYHLHTGQISNVSYSSKCKNQFVLNDNGAAGAALQRTPATITINNTPCNTAP